MRVGYGYTGSIDHNALPFVTMKLTETRPYAGLVVPHRIKMPTLTLMANEKGL